MHAYQNSVQLQKKQTRRNEIAAKKLANLRNMLSPLEQEAQDYSDFINNCSDPSIRQNAAAIGKVNLSAQPPAFADLSNEAHAIPASELALFMTQTSGQSLYQVALGTPAAELLTEASVHAYMRELMPGYGFDFEDDTHYSYDNTGQRTSVEIPGVWARALLDLVDSFESEVVAAATRTRKIAQANEMKQKKAELLMQVAETLDSADAIAEFESKLGNYKNSERVMSAVHGKPAVKSTSFNVNKAMHSVPSTRSASSTAAKQAAMKKEAAMFLGSQTDVLSVEDTLIDTL